jgi:hypothetical protein
MMPVVSATPGTAMVSAPDPHDPTSDQWFNEVQFAAYAELGRIMGSEAMKCAKAFVRDGELIWKGESVG